MWGPAVSTSKIAISGSAYASGFSAMKLSHSQSRAARTRSIISTNYAERQNLTIRMHMRGLTRLRNAIFEEIEKLAHGVSLYFCVLQLRQDSLIPARNVGHTGQGHGPRLGRRENPGLGKLTHYRAARYLLRFRHA